MGWDAMEWDGMVWDANGMCCDHKGWKHMDIRCNQLVVCLYNTVQYNLNFLLY